MKTLNIYQKKRYRKFAISLSFLVFGITFFLSPYFALFRFKKALDNSDHETLNSMIAFSSLRKSLKKQIKAPIARKLKKQIGSNLFFDLGMLMAEPLVNTIVDSTTTPRGIKLLLKNGVLSNSNTSNDLEKSTLPKVDDSYKKHDNKRNLFYTSPNKCV